MRLIDGLCDPSVEVPTLVAPPEADTSRANTAATTERMELKLEARETRRLLLELTTLREVEVLRTLFWPVPLLLLPLLVISDRP